MDQADWIILRTMLMHIAAQSDFQSKLLLKVRFDQCGATEEQLADIDQAIVLNKLSTSVFGTDFDKEKADGE